MGGFMKCRRGWYMSYYRSLRRKKDFASLPNIGTLVHAGLEAYYRGASETPWDVPLAMGAQLVADYPEEAAQIQKDIEMARIMLEGYLQIVIEEEGADANFEMVDAEKMVEVALQGTPYRLRGKIDARVRRLNDGALLQLEHKTVGDLVTLPKTAQQAPQFLTYDLLAFLEALATGDPSIRTDGVILNMLRRVKRTARANPPFYARHVIQHNEEELRNHFRHVVAIGDMISEARAKLDAGADHHSVCPPTIDKNHMYGCSCAAVGNMFDDGSDVEGFLSEFYEIVDPLERYAVKEAV
jgi:hypothetical protein